MESMQDLLLEEIRDLYDAEKQLVRALPKFSKAASHQELKAVFDEHLEVTRGQVQRLEQVFEMLGQRPRSKPCKAMKGLIEEGQEIMQEEGEEVLLDEAMIGAAQKVEHYEIASYGTARTIAKNLGMNDAARLLQQTLDEEGAADKKLTQVAMRLYKESTRTRRGAEQEEEDGGGRTGRGRGNAGASARGRGNARADAGQRGSAASSARGRGSAGTSTSGRGSAGTSTSGRGSAGASARGRGSAGASTSGRGSAGTSARERGSSGTSERRRSGGGTAERQRGTSGRSGGRASASAKRSSGSARGRSSANGRGGAGAITTTDHEEIRNWAEERGASPSCVRGTGGKSDAGLLRFDFPGYSGDDSLEHIEWDEFFEKFDDQGLALLYQPQTAAGETSNFNKIVSRETAEGRGSRKATGARKSTAGRRR